MDETNIIAFGALAVAFGTGLTSILVSVRSLELTRQQIGLATAALDDARKLEQQRREGQHRGLRLGMVAVMHDTAAWVKELGVALDAFPLETLREGKAVQFTEYDRNYEAAIAQVVEAGLNDAVTARLALLQSNIRVVSARIGGLGGKSQTSINGPGRISLMRDLLVVYTQAISLLLWADKRQETVFPLTLNDLSSSFPAFTPPTLNMLHLQEHLRHVDSEANAELI